ncbi:hypothetical protein CLV63_103189 [Murinocardiopsis flavida]|uniref:Ketoreductase domain-containing protein n=1 Tax=Murinocardiopsis flavida TaxID=645275 RepID=A0A2P8DQL1_9ACTN|nr:SDR family NAD(P)-dependent oxidoreductase [Murinocardiopsis flavida]PSK99464.1 hypothetical protein CLV63_103189 [Murinocardiopsis flavida]
MSAQRTPARTALITGASGGIGAEYARQLAERGFSLVLVARRADLLAESAAGLSARYGVGVTPLPADLAAPEGLAAVEERLEAGDGGAEAPVDLLVNNAGRGDGGRFSRQAIEELDAVVELNVRVLMRLTRTVLPVQIARAEAGAAGPLGVVNVASVAGLLPGYASSAAYAASKAFVLSFTESTAMEVRKHGVHVSAVVSGFVRTDMTAGLQERGAPDIAFVPKERVVRDSLRAWAGGRVLVTPGAQYKVAGGLLKVLPRGVYRRVMGR